MFPLTFNVTIRPLADDIFLTAELLSLKVEGVKTPSSFLLPVIWDTNVSAGKPKEINE
jgi:hypothetical protein